MGRWVGGSIGDSVGRRSVGMLEGKNRDRERDSERERERERENKQVVTDSTPLLLGML